MVKRMCSGFFVIIVIAAVLLLCPVFRAEATVRYVTSGADDPSNPVSGTFRSAVLNASAGDVIRFSGGGTTVVLADQINIDKTLTIEGPATIRQGATDKRVLEVSATCTMKNITVTGGNFANQGLSAMKGAGIYNRTAGILTMNSCTVTGNTGGGAVENCGTLTMNSCTLTNNTNFLAFGSAVTNVYLGGGLHATATLTGCTIENNDVAGSLGGAIYNGDILAMSNTKVCNNATGRGSGLLSRWGGGLYLNSRSNTTLTNGCRVTGNDPSQVYKVDTPYSTPVFTYDDTCTIGDAPNKSATAFAGYSGEMEPEPRSIIGDADVNDVRSALADSGSDLFASVRQALSSDLGRTPGGTSATLAGLTASLYYANTFEDVAIENTDLVVEYTASWPENTRYYALFCKADGTGYEIPERGIQFEIKAGQSLPDGVTPPDFYVEGEGLMTWRNVVTDNGSYDLNPTAGVVTFRVCSVRAAEATGDKGSGGGCNAGTGCAPLALLLAAPLLATVRRRKGVSPNRRTRHTVWAAGVLLVLTVFLCLGGTGEATNLMVSYGGDDGREGSLRSVVAAAAAGDRIIFHSSVSTVSLTDYLFVNKALTIEGPVTIKQTKPGARVLYVTGACTLKNLTITGGSLASGSAAYGAGVYCYADLTMTNCTVTGNTGGGGIQNFKNLVLQGCTISGNSANGSSKAGGIGNSAFGSWNVSLTMTDCVVENNTCVNGNSGGIYNGVKGTLTMARTTIRNNSNSGLGGGMYLSAYATTTLTDHCAVYGNSPDNIRCGYDATYSADDTCTIGSAPNKSATAFSGYSGETEPEPRSIVGDADVAEVTSALANPESGLYEVIEKALAADLGKTVAGKATSLTGMAATLYAANTFEDVALTSADLAVEYTASWPSNVRYYALFARADGSGYELADRGVQFEIKAGQSLPDGVTPPDFYVPGEGLMTWKNIVTDNGSYDLDPAVGVVTIRVCSVRAAEVTGDKGSGGGCDAGAGCAPLALLLAAPLLATGIGGRKN